MNYKALATIFLLVLPMLIVPIALANQPSWNVEFRIRPGDTKFYGPCKVSTTFPEDVYLWNDKSLTGVGVYAYDFYVYWQNDVGISLVSFVNHIPWDAGKFYLVINETGTFGPSPTFDYYHLAVTAIGNSTLDPALELGATSVFNASLVTLTFHIDSEPFYPAAAHADFLIGNENGADFNPVPNPDPFFDPHVSTGCTHTITNIEIEQGAYDETVGQPEIDVEASLAAPYPDNITFSAKGVTEKVYIHLYNITGAYGFTFHLSWDWSWKQTDIQHVTILPAFSPPYAYLSEWVDNNTGTMYFSLIKPSEKPTLCSQDAAVIEIDFVTTPQVAEAGQIPSTGTSYITIDWADVFVKDATGHENDYSSWDTTKPGVLLISAPLANIYVPKSDADVNFDGIVDITDLATVAMLYGQPSIYANFVSPPGINVDIFDIVYVAKRFGDP